MSTVKTEFYEKVQRFMCDVSLLPADSPLCKENPEFPNLDAFHKGGYWKSAVPFVEPAIVKYCTAYTKHIAGQLCADISTETQDRIFELIIGNEPIPSYPEVLRMVRQKAEGVSSGQYRRLEKYYDTAADEIYAGLVEIRNAPAETKPQLQRELLKKTRRVCIADNMDAENQLKMECEQVIDEHKAAKEDRNTVLKIIGGLLASLWAFIKTDRGEEAYDVASAAKAKAKAAGAGFFRRNWTGLKTFVRRAIWRAPKENAPGDTSATPTTDGSGAPAPSDGSAPPADPTKPPPANADFALVRDVVIPEVARRVEDTGKYLLEVTRTAFGEGSLSSTTLGQFEDTSSLDTDPVTRLPVLASWLYSEETARVTQSLADNLRQKTFNELVPDAAYELTSISTAAKAGEAVSVAGRIDRLSTALSDIAKLRNKIAKLSAELAYVVGWINSWTAVPASRGSLTTQLRKAVDNMRNAARDTEPVLDAMRDALAAAQSPGSLFHDTQSGEHFDLSQVNTLIGSVAWLNSFEAQRRKVEIKTSELDVSLQIPEGTQKDLLHVLYETTNIGMANIDPAGENRSITVKATLKGNLLTFNVLDNSRVETGAVSGPEVSAAPVRRTIARPRSARPLPAVPESTATAESTSAFLEICRRNGWNFSTNQRTGRVAIITLDTKDWPRRSSPSQGGAGPAGGESGSGGPSPEEIIPLDPTPAGASAFQGIVRPQGSIEPDEVRGGISWKPGGGYVGSAGPNPAKSPAPGFGVELGMGPAGAGAAVFFPGYAPPAVASPTPAP